jgi:hypothetical protein
MFYDCLPRLAKRMRVGSGEFFARLPAACGKGQKGEQRCFFHKGVPASAAFGLK